MVQDPNVVTFTFWGETPGAMRLVGFLQAFHAEFGD